MAWRFTRYLSTIGPTETNCNPLCVCVYVHLFMDGLTVMFSWVLTSCSGCYVNNWTLFTATFAPRKGCSLQSQEPQLRYICPLLAIIFRGIHAGGLHSIRKKWNDILDYRGKVCQLIFSFAEGLSVFWQYNHFYTRLYLFYKDTYIRGIWSLILAALVAQPVGCCRLYKPQISHRLLVLDAVCERLSLDSDSCRSYFPILFETHLKLFFFFLVVG